MTNAHLSDQTKNIDYPSMVNIRNAPSESTDELFLTGLHSVRDEKLNN